MPSAPATVALALVVHGCGIPITLAVPPTALASRTMRIAVIAPVWFPVPPTGYGGIELVVSLLADGLVDAGHDVTLFASGGSRTKAALVSPMAEPPDPHELGNPWYDALPRARVVPAGERFRHRARSLRHRRTDLRRVAAGQATRRAHAARSVDRSEPAAVLAAREAPAPRRDQRRATRGQPRRAVRGHRAQRHRPVGVQVPRRQGARSCTSGAPTPTRVPTKRSRSRGARLAAAHAPQARRAARTRVLRARDRAAARLRRGAVRERHARREDRAARPGVRDGVPDPLARAVRPRDDRGDGVRHAGGHHQLGRRARARRRRRHRLSPRRRGRPRGDDRPGRHPRPGRLPAAGRGPLLGRGHGPRLRGRVRAGPLGT